MFGRPRPIPIAPIIVSALLLAGTGWYLRGSTAPAWRATSRDTFGLLSWSASCLTEEGFAAVDLADAIGGLGLDVIALQGLSAEEDAAALADSMGPGWRFEAIGGPGGEYLAVLWGSGLKVASYHLVATPGGDALAVRLQDDKGRYYLVVSLQSGGADGDDSAYFGGVLSWCRAHPASLTLLAGPVDLQDRSAEVTAEGFIAVGDRSAGSNRVYIAPPTAKVIQAGVLDQEVPPEGRDPALVVEIAPPAPPVG